MPNTWISSPTHNGQNEVHAAADWCSRMEKEDAQRLRQRLREGLGAEDDGPADFNTWEWGASQARADSSVNPMHYNNRTTLGDLMSVALLPAAPITIGPDREAMRTELEQRRPGSADFPVSRPSAAPEWPGDNLDRGSAALIARTWDVGSGTSWDNPIAAMAYFTQV